LAKFSRDTLKALIVVEMLTQGVYFDSRRVRALPVHRNMISRAMNALMGAGVATRSRARNKYLLTDEFLDALRQEITRGMPRGTFVRFPDLSVFDICGIGEWSGEELDSYLSRLRQRWMLRKGVL
jgi:hypothetical protein